jgi:hypothetical protein
VLATFGRAQIAGLPPGMLSPLEQAIPPEAPTGSKTGTASHVQDDVWQRLVEWTDSTLTWQPDQVSQARLADDEGITLETRGIIQHPPVTLVVPTPSPQQLAFWAANTSHKFSIAAKLRTAGWEEDARKLEDCHSFHVVQVCNDCGRVAKFPNRCDQFFCPECQPHLAKERTRQVEWWTNLIAQPKHVTLTVKNIPDLTSAHVDELRAMFTRLRRRKFARGWKGGFYAIECTNEGRGWHLHIHALINAKWIDTIALRDAWQASTKGFGRIVNVRDCRGQDYLREVTKYAVKGVQLASWSPEQITTFISAFRGKRTFGVFGNLFAQRTQFAEFIATLKSARPKCECGSCNVRYMDDHEYLLLDLVPTTTALPRPPPEPTLGLKFDAPRHNVRD